MSTLYAGQAKSMCLRNIEHQYIEVIDFIEHHIVDAVNECKFEVFISLLDEFPGLTNDEMFGICLYFKYHGFAVERHFIEVNGDIVERLELNWE